MYGRPLSLRSAWPQKWNRALGPRSGRCTAQPLGAGRHGAARRQRALCRRLARRVDVGHRFGSPAPCRTNVGASCPSRHEAAGASTAKSAAREVRARATAFDTGVGDRVHQLGDAHGRCARDAEQLRLVVSGGQIAASMHPHPESMDGRAGRHCDRRVQPLLVRLRRAECDGEMVGLSASGWVAVGRAQCPDVVVALRHVESDLRGEESAIRVLRRAEQFGWAQQCVGGHVRRRPAHFFAGHMSPWEIRREESLDGCEERGSDVDRGWANSAPLCLDRLALPRDAFEHAFDGDTEQRVGVVGERALQAPRAESAAMNADRAGAELSLRAQRSEVFRGGRSADSLRRGVPAPSAAECVIARHDRAVGARRVRRDGAAGVLSDGAAEDMLTYSSRCGSGMGAAGVACRSARGHAARN